MSLNQAQLESVLAPSKIVGMDSFSRKPIYTIRVSVACYERARELASVGNGPQWVAGSVVSDGISVHTVDPVWFAEMDKQIADTQLGR